MKKNGELDASVVERVVKDAARERREALSVVEGLVGDLQGIERDNQAEFQEYWQAAIDAEAAVRAHEKYEAHLTRQAYDKEHAALKKAAGVAAAKRDQFQEKIREQAKPLQKSLQEAKKRVEDLEAEWRYHARTAKVLGLDVSALEA